jgi:hypothetical protein
VYVVQHGWRRSACSQLNHLSTYLQVYRPQTGRMNACSLYSQKIWYASSSATHHAPCLELCRITTSPRGMRNNNGSGTSSASPRVLRTLALPIFQPDHRGHTAYLQMDRYFPHRRNLEVLQQQQREPARARSPQIFRRSSVDIISPPKFHWITAHAGQCWLSLEDDRPVKKRFQYCAHPPSLYPRSIPYQRISLTSAATCWKRR